MRLNQNRLINIIMTVQHIMKISKLILSVLFLGLNCGRNPKSNMENAIIHNITYGVCQPATILRCDWNIVCESNSAKDNETSQPIGIQIRTQWRPELVFFAALKLTHRRISTIETTAIVTALEIPKSRFIFSILTWLI